MQTSTSHVVRQSSDGRSWLVVSDAEGELFKQSLTEDEARALASTSPKLTDAQSARIDSLEADYPATLFELEPAPEREDGSVQVAWSDMESEGTLRLEADGSMTVID
jgi:hypothetical protein